MHAVLAADAVTAAEKAEVRRVDAEKAAAEAVAKAEAETVEALKSRDKALSDLKAMEGRLSQMKRESAILDRQMQQRALLLSRREEEAVKLDQSNRQSAKREVLLKMGKAQQLVANRVVTAERRVILGQCFRALALNAAASKLVADRRRFREIAVATSSQDKASVMKSREGLPKVVDVMKSREGLPKGALGRLAID